MIQRCYVVADDVSDFFISLLRYSLGYSDGRYSPGLSADYRSVRNAARPQKLIQKKLRNLSFSIEPTTNSD